ncbi:MAG TPA: UDP-N-acetylmuramate dehydrogenase, partial [Rhodanobacteraceae bacterium]|nr:UDP-N-acetylmuramate dehydrogenase [Rhodanobacteraceae bacterium]
MAIETARVDLGGYTLLEDANLRTRNTLRVDARASLFAEVHDPNALPALLDWPALRGMRTLVLGEGSNVLFVSDFDGLIVTLKTRGTEIIGDDERYTRIRVATGEHWNDVVRWSLARGLCGLENLSLIPGTAGAAPVQNIGAYGVELEEFVRAVEAFDLRQKRLETFSKADCAFAYRDSRFKREPDRWLITSLELDLPKSREPVIDYAGVHEELAAMKIEGKPTSAHVAEAVVRLRTRKLPEPALIPNAGSFFKNPIVSLESANELKHDHPALPLWQSDEAHAKLSAAWLIEASGFKGAREGDAGISERHAL